MVWPDHHTILIGAGGVGLTKEGKFLDLSCVWAGHDDKRPIRGVEAAEFYLSLPDRYGSDCYFVMFSFNYDVTMLLKGLRQGRSEAWHYNRVWTICKRQDMDTGKVRNNTIHIGDYSISYIKSKVLVIHKLDTSNPDEKRQYPVLKRITLFDVFGFYRTSFVEVASSLVSLGLATKEEVETMRQNKARRNDFKSSDWPLSRIKTYTEAELRKLSIAVTVLRKAAAEDGMPS